MMNYYFSKKLPQVSFEEALNLTRKALQDQGFGVIGEIDFQKTMKEKVGADFRKYMVLQACSPQDAYRSLLAEDTVGLLLPCNLLVQEKEDGVEVSSIDPENVMAGLDSKEMRKIAVEVGHRLKQVIGSL